MRPEATGQIKDNTDKPPGPEHLYKRKRRVTLEAKQPGEDYSEHKGAGSIRQGEGGL